MSCPPDGPADGVGGEPLDPAGWTESGLDEGLSAAFGRPAPGTSGIPSRLGHYEIHGILGEGGMGRVFDASEQFPARRIALKVLRPGMATPQLTQRFEREALLLGRLQHPGIARVHAAGVLETDEGPVPYLAMELVDGLPLDDWLVAHEPDRATRIELVADVADAIHHAHLKGVVHRDLKPKNVLVSPTGSPSVVDFGIACAVGQDTIQGLRTAAGQFLGTLPFMAPEQVAGDAEAIDARADVYGLGCLLYVTLSGQLPLDVTDGNLATAVHAILERAPTPLGERDPSLRGDLEVIAAKALHKDPERRYESAAALAADLRRHLTHQPILARPATALYQLTRLARRHRASFALGVLFLVAIVAGATGTLVQAQRAADGRALAEAERDTKSSINALLLSNLSNSSPFHRGAPTRAADNLRELERQLDAVVDHEVELPLRLGLAEGYRELGLLDDAERSVIRADALLAGQDAPDPLAVLGAEVEACKILVERSHWDEALPRLGAAVERATELHGPDSAFGLSAEAALIVCRTRVQPSDELISLAQDLHERTKAALGPHARETIYAVRIQAGASIGAGRMDAAVELARRHVAQCQEAFGLLHPQTLAAQSDLGSMLSWSGHTDEATELLEATLHDAARVFGDDSWVRRQLTQTIGENHSNAGRFYDAVEALAEAAALCDKTLGPTHSETLMCRDQLGIALRRSGDQEQALQVFQDVRRLREESLGPESLDLGGSWTAIAITQRNLGQYDEALASFRRSKAINLVHHDRGFHNILWTDTATARLLLLMDRPGEAAELMAEVVPLRAELVPTDDPTYLVELMLFGDALLAAGQPDAARDAYTTCRATRPINRTRASWDLQLDWALARCLAAEGDAKAEQAALDELARALAEEPADDAWLRDLRPAVTERLEALRAAP